MVDLKSAFLVKLQQIVVLMAMLPVVAISQASNELVKISTDPWEPWVVGEEGEVATDGIAVDLTKEVFRRLGVDIEINIYPYKRCMSQMKSGERDLLLMAKKTEEREKFMLFSDVVVSDPQLIYYSRDHRENFEWNSWEDFKNHIIGGVAGFNYGEFEAAREKYKLNTEYVANDTQNIKKLLSGRIDFVLLSRSTANFYTSRNPEVVNKLKAAARPVAAAEFHFAASRKGNAVKYMPEINKVIADMKKDGTLNKILGL